MGDSNLLSDIGSWASITGLSVAGVAKAGFGVCKQYFDLKKISKDEYREPLKKQLKEVLRAIAEGDGIKGNWLRIGLADNIKVQFLQALTDDSILDDILSVCVAAITEDWSACVARRSEELSRIKNCCSADGLLNENTFFSHMKALVPLLVIAMFNGLTVNERASFAKIDALEHRVEDSLRIICSKLDRLCSDNKTSELEFNAECVRSYAFFNSLPFLHDEHIEKIMCKAARLSEDPNYLEKLDDYFVKKQDASSIFDDIFRAIRDLDSDRLITWDEDIKNDIRCLCFLILVIKSEFERCDQLDSGWRRFYKCSYHDESLRDLDAMLSPILAKKFEPQSIKRYYYEFDLPETGFRRASILDTGISAIYRALQREDYDVAKLQDNERRKLDQKKDLFLKAINDDSPHFHFMVFSDPEASDVSRELSRVFPQVVFVNKSNEDKALRVATEEDYEKLLSDLDATLV